MSQGLYTAGQIANYLGVRKQDVARMVKDDGLPVVRLPGKQRLVAKITLHGLHEWMSARHSGTAFMTVEQLAVEIAAANAGSTPAGLGVLQFHYVMQIVIDALSKERVERKAVA